MRQRLASIAVAVITATALVLPLSAQKAKTWSYLDTDVFENGASVSTADRRGRPAHLLISEYSEDDWKTISYYIWITLLEKGCLKKIPVVKVWIDGWRKDIPTVNLPSRNICIVSLQPDNMANLMQRINQGNTIYIKWPNGLGESRLFEFDISGEIALLQGGAAK